MCVFRGDVWSVESLLSEDTSVLKGGPVVAKHWVLWWKTNLPGGNNNAVASVVVAVEEDGGIHADTNNTCSR